MFFEEMGKIDLIEPIQDEMLAGRLIVHIEAETGKPYIKLIPQTGPVDPWIHSVRGSERFCAKWLKLYFTCYNLIPKSCMSCWKVVAEPKNLKMAIEMVELQKGMGFESKTGLELRPYSPGLWHSFWYCRLDEGLEGALRLHKKVEAKVKREFGIMMKVSLKRACTEMEVRKGPSENWVYTPEDEMLEQLLDDFIRMDKIVVDQSPIIQAFVYRNWVKEAFSRGDPTVKEFAQMTSFIRGSTTYDDGEQLKRDEVPQLFETWKEEKDEPSGILRLS